MESISRLIFKIENYRFTSLAGPLNACPDWLELKEQLVTHCGRQGLERADAEATTLMKIADLQQRVAELQEMLTKYKTLYKYRAVIER